MRSVRLPALRSQSFDMAMAGMLIRSRRTKQVPSEEGVSVSVYAVHVDGMSVYNPSLGSGSVRDSRATPVLFIGGFKGVRCAGTGSLVRCVCVA